MQKLLRRCLTWVIVAAVLPSTALAGPNEDFFGAAMVDNVREIRSLLSQGFDPNTVERERGDTALILALREESMNVFEELVNARGINLDAKSGNGDNALMIAAYKGNLPAVETLLAKGASVNRPNWTALHYAASSGATKIVELLLRAGANPNALSPNKTTPLMMAAGGGHASTVKLLLDNGANATLRNEVGMTALEFTDHFDNKNFVEDVISQIKQAQAAQANARSLAARGR